MPPRETICQRYAYDRTTGTFTRKYSVGKYRQGELAGMTNRAGYILVGIHSYGQFFAHRLAWVVEYGSLSSDDEIDHIDGNPSNNAISNLRLATSSQQKMNKRVQSNNRAGLKGAYYHDCHKGKKWRSQIKAGGRLIFLGYFHTAEDAHEAYCAAAPQYHGSFHSVRGAPVAELRRQLEPAAAADAQESAG